VRTPIKFLAALMVMTVFVAPHAHAATLAPVDVMSDPTGDHPLGDDTTPLGSASDLVGGAIGETDDAIQLVWKVADLRDELAQPIPSPIVLYYEFKLAAPDGGSGLFSVRVRLYPDEPRPSTSDPTNVPPPMVPPVWPFGGLYSNCTTTGTLVSCTWNRDANVTVTEDVVANTITASVPRAFLKSNDGKLLAVDGAQLQDQALFQGIAVCVSTVAIISGNACDVGTQDDAYTLGTPRE
jgi:hypothetical protein